MVRHGYRPSIMTWLMPAAIALAIACVASCSRPVSDVTRACIAIASQTGAVPAAVQEKCECSDRAMQSYLDPQNYALLAKVAATALSQDSGSGKLRRLAGALIAQGVNPLQASLTAADLMMALHKAEIACFRSSG